MQTQAESLLALATAQRFPVWVGLATCLGGWAMAVQGRSETGTAQLYQGLEAFLATRHELSRPFCLVLLAEVASQVGHITEGLH